jgi:Domain of unknown function (DUF1992)
VTTHEPRREPRPEPESQPRRRRLGPRWEDAVEQSIQDAMGRGEFDRLPGTGKPIAGLDGPHDELWWVKDKLRREEIATVPPSLAVRRDRDELRAHLHTFTSERAVREAVEELNGRIRTLNRYGSASGPPTSLMPQDVDEYVARWREATAGSGT